MRSNCEMGCVRSNNHSRPAYDSFMVAAKDAVNVVPPFAQRWADAGHTQNLSEEKNL